jgi:hypothetical protein
MRRRARANAPAAAAADGYSLPVESFEDSVHALAADNPPYHEPHAEYDDPPPLPVDDIPAIMRQRRDTIERVRAEERRRQEQREPPPEVFLEGQEPAVMPDEGEVVGGVEPAAQAPRASAKKKPHANREDRRRRAAEWFAENDRRERARIARSQRARRIITSFREGFWAGVEAANPPEEAGARPFPRDLNALRM